MRIAFKPRLLGAPPAKMAGPAEAEQRVKARGLCCFTYDLEAGWYRVFDGASRLGTRITEARGWLMYQEGGRGRMAAIR